PRRRPPHTQVAVEVNDALDAGDLVVFIEATVEPADDPLSELDSDEEEFTPSGKMSSITV
ncbi:hypothetical protein TSOC_003585, partial [Tetrabaena socialis]